MFRITEFAALAGTSAKVLRDYDRAGIFRPAWIDRTTSYRGYSPAQLPALRRILSLRDLGVPLRDIRRHVLDGADLATILDERRAALERARVETERRLAAVGIGLDGRMPGAIDVVVREVRPELVGVMEVARAGGDVGRAFLELERAIQAAGVRAPRPPALVRELDGRSWVAVPVRRAVPRAFTAERLPAIRAATAIHRGDYATLEATHRDLLAWLRATGLDPVGPTRVLYLQFGAEDELRLPARYLVREDADQMTELQVAVDAA